MRPAKVIANLIALFSISCAFASPYWNQHQVPLDSEYANTKHTPTIKPFNTSVSHLAAIDILRIQTDWQENTESYQLAKSVIEPSGTLAFIARSKQKPIWGSYRGVLLDQQTGKEVYYDAIGTGKEYRKLTRAINLRFPVPNKDMTFELYAENPRSGIMEKVLTQTIYANKLVKVKTAEVEIKELALATLQPSLRVNIYAEGYAENEKQLFWQQANKVVETLQQENFPGVKHLSFYGVYHSSKKSLGIPQDLGLPIPEFDSFLGLYYPYWDNFGRWYDTVYPTREDKLRQGLATAPYDYPIVLVNSTGYWGVGNYMSLTAIPGANAYNFKYLLLHEFGHFFGLNEEYEGGGRTELEFAPDIVEPWSQNITLLTDPRYINLKWKSFVDSNTPLPTPDSIWQSTPPVYGAYIGGYASSPSTRGRSHKPGLNCTMEARAHFCHICAEAIEQVIEYSLGQ